MRCLIYWNLNLLHISAALLLLNILDGPSTKGIAAISDGWWFPWYDWMALYKVFSIVSTASTAESKHGYNNCQVSNTFNKFWEWQVNHSMSLSVGFASMVWFMSLMNWKHSFVADEMFPEMNSKIHMLLQP